MPERLDRGRLRERVHAERLADRVDGLAELGRPDRVADPQAGQAEVLRERAQQDQVRERLPQVDGVLRVVAGLEVDVGLVEDHDRVLRHPLEERADLRRRDVGSGRVVRVADDDELGRRRDLGEHRVEVVDVPVGERNADLPRAGQRRQVRVHRERRPGVDDLGPRLAERLGGREQDLAGAVRDGDLSRVDLVLLGELAAQDLRVRVRVAIGLRRGPGHRLGHVGVRRVGRLVRGELRDLGDAVLLARVRRGQPGRVLGQASELLGEGDGHRWARLGPRPHCAPRDLSAARRPRRGRRGAARARSARSSGPAPGSPAPSSPAPGSRGCRGAARG